MDDLHKSQIPKTPYCILYMKIYLNTGFDLLLLIIISYFEYLPLMMIVMRES